MFCEAIIPDRAPVTNIMSNLGRRLIKAAREGRAIARGNVRVTCADQIEKTLREIDRIAQWPDCIKPLSATLIDKVREL
jgi:hypothetical protein